MNSSKLTLIASAGLLAAVFIFSCTKDVGKLPVKAEAPKVGECDTITYSKHIKKIVDDNCVSCHNASLQSGGVSLLSYGEVKDRADAGRIKARVIDGENGFMPQGGELSPQLKKLISCWLDNGKKE